MPKTLTLAAWRRKPFAYVTTCLVTTDTESVIDHPVHMRQCQPSLNGRLGLQSARAKAVARALE